MSDKEAFNKWLNNKLKSLNTDESVFGSYILGILEGDESGDEKREALEGILSAIIVSVNHRSVESEKNLLIYIFFTNLWIIVCRKMTLKMW